MAANNVCFPSCEIGSPTNVDKWSLLGCGRGESRSLLPPYRLHFGSTSHQTAELHLPHALPSFERLFFWDTEFRRLRCCWPYTTNGFKPVAAIAVAPLSAQDSLS